jgi:hypothetical protein
MRLQPLSLNGRRQPTGWRGTSRARLATVAVCTAATWGVLTVGGIPVASANTQPSAGHHVAAVHCPTISGACQADRVAIATTKFQHARQSGTITCVLTVNRPGESRNPLSGQHYIDFDAYLRCTVTGSVHLESMKVRHALDQWTPIYGTWGRISTYRTCGFPGASGHKFHCGSVVKCRPSIKWTYRQEAVAWARHEFNGVTYTLRIPRKGTGYSRTADLGCS